ncbi:MAG TPA: MATE family efflux transporter [Gallionellaceae bacterium]
MQKPPSLSRELLRFTWPVLIAQLALMANAVIDTAMAGRLSAVDLAAVGIGAAIAATVVMSLISVLLALTPMVAHLYGAGKRDEIGRELHQAVWIALVLATVAMVLLVFPEPFVRLASLQPAVEEKVRAYLAASAWAVPATIALRLFSGLSTGIGRPRPVMAFNLLALCLKIPLNAMLMYGWLGMPALGGPGAAYATAIDQWVMALIAWSWCLNHSGYAEFQLRRRFAAPEWAAIRAFLKLGLPIGVTFVADVTAFTLMALFIARLGPVVSGAHQIAANLAATAFMFPLALGNATSALAGQALGAAGRERARRICWRGIRIGLTVGLMISLAFWLGAPYIAALYTSDRAVQAAAIPLITLVGFYHLGDAVQAVAVNALRGYKKSGVPMVIYGVLLWGPGLGGGIVLGLTGFIVPAMGAPGFWIAAIAALWTVAASMAVYLERVSRVTREP